MGTEQDLVEGIRFTSRNLVRQLGFMGGRFAGTKLSPSTVHALIEIGRESITASELTHLLLLEKSSVSRMLRKLKGQGMVYEEPCKTDCRVKRLSLTMKGSKHVEEIHQFARHQVVSALNKLELSQQYTIQRGLELYSGALSGDDVLPKKTRVEIIEGYVPSVVGQITQLHASYYSRESGFGAKFEAVVANGLADFCCRLDNPVNQIWTAILGGEIIGSIAIDGEDLGDSKAHLRWFIVSDKARGTGVGKVLLDIALAFVDTLNFAETHLWTFSGLNTARYLYETRGFLLEEEHLGSRWGTEVTEQCFVRLSCNKTSMF
ncbi:bifunctional helix-turn-helix transcriptional regulator/GNAT family N-acetyltransferase [Vibrio sp. DW001]|uniref:bifunctional helix-turn-helix transcriptional regulator/GNAT family N-acetyltransferase n=1 Tax=Vibrio sp. DW001 TaxID=2912315 RepID=UPI0023AEFF85|nr:bifunctional helix-turn-helix transcriptional regulator/GNAT family N-acetyltransferase [Vibrio sp. DW001]WED25212.1 bifunctional helix-turn-helix transcriptional regulator/GNAT family N-acetyltransferase [Vibrio sp. DW001]